MLCKETMDTSSIEDQQKLNKLLREKHEAFALRNEKLIQFNLRSYTGDVAPKQQSVCRVPYAV